MTQSVIIRLQHLSWTAGAADIRRFFIGLNIPEGGVHIVGGEKGDAFIVFSSDEDARVAMQRDGQQLCNESVKLLLSSKTEMQNVIAIARGQPAPVAIPAQPAQQQMPNQMMGMNSQQVNYGMLDNRMGYDPSQDQQQQQQYRDAGQQQYNMQQDKPYYDTTTNQYQPDNYRMDAKDQQGYVGPNNENLGNYPTQYGEQQRDRWHTPSDPHGAISKQPTYSPRFEGDSTYNEEPSGFNSTQPKLSLPVRSSEKLSEDKPRESGSYKDSSRNDKESSRSSRDRDRERTRDRSSRDSRSERDTRRSSRERDRRDREPRSDSKSRNGDRDSRSSKDSRRDRDRSERSRDKDREKSDRPRTDREKERSGRASSRDTERDPRRSSSRHEKVADDKVPTDAPPKESRDPRVRDDQTKRPYPVTSSSDEMPAQRRALLDGPLLQRNLQDDMRSLPENMSGPQMRDGPMRDSHMRDGPENMSGPQMRDGPMRDSHMRDGPMRGHPEDPRTRHDDNLPPNRLGPHDDTPRNRLGPQDDMPGRRLGPPDSMHGMRRGDMQGPDRGQDNMMGPRATQIPDRRGPMGDMGSRNEDMYGQDDMMRPDDMGSYGPDDIRGGPDAIRGGPDAMRIGPNDMPGQWRGGPSGPGQWRGRPGSRFSPNDNMGGPGPWSDGPGFRGPGDDRPPQWHDGPGPRMGPRERPPMMRPPMRGGDGPPFMGEGRSRRGDMALLPTPGAPPMNGPRGPPPMNRNDWHPMDSFPPEGDMYMRGQKRPREPFFTVFLSNLPLTVSYREIRRFFTGCEVPFDGLKLINNEYGERNGTAYMRFLTVKDMENALGRNGDFMGESLISIARCSEEEFENAIDSYVPPRGSINVAPKRLRSRSPPQSRDNCVMLKGLPQKIDTNEIQNILSGLSVIANSIYIEYDIDGKALGPAYLEFTNTKDFSSAVSQRYFNMGSYKVEATPMTRKEIEGRVKNHKDFLENREKDGDSLKDKKGNDSKVHSGQQSNGKNGSEDSYCVHLIGLPYSANIGDISDFFGGLKIVKAQMMVSPEGQPTGIAYVEFDNKADLDNALTKNNEYMGKRYIQVMHVSKDEMDSQIQNSIPITNEPQGPPMRRDNPPMLRDDPPMLRDDPPMRRDDPPMRRNAMPPGPMMGRPRGPPPPNVGRPCVVRMTNINYRLSAQEVSSFFAGFNPLADSVRFKLSDSGSPTGVASIAFGNPADADRAIRELNGQMMHGRVVHMYPFTQGPPGPM